MTLAASKQHSGDTFWFATTHPDEMIGCVRMCVCVRWLPQAIRIRVGDI